MQDRALQCDVILIEIISIKQILINHYLSDPHLLFKKSNSLIVGPHLSGLESLGQTVTVGKGNSSMGYVNVSSTVTMGLSYHAKKIYNLIRISLIVPSKRAGGIFSTISSHGSKCNILYWCALFILLSS